MINMKLSKKAATALVETSPGDAPAYPYGLRLCLDTETLEKLGITDLPRVGTVITLQARAEVVSTGVNQEQDGDKRMHCDLQITDMALDGGDKSPAQKLYAGMAP